jgi:hypothetical protein
VISDGQRGEGVDLGEFGMEFADLVLVPDGRTEPVMGDGRDHEKPGSRRIQARIYPVGTLHAGLLPRAREGEICPGLLAGSGQSVGFEPLPSLTADLVNRHHMADVISQRRGTVGTITNSM